MEQPIRIAVASDLHAYSGGNAPAPSHLNIQAPEDSPLFHPISGLIQLINSRHLLADALLCPGDLGHQADPAAIQYAWGALSRVGQALTASVVTATAGNHDIDSRRLHNDHAADHILKGLVPSFPFNQPNLDDRYWARAYAILDTDRYRLLVVNSSMFHGTAEIEKNHGRVDPYTLNSIRDDLKQRKSYDVNFLLCHHHPHQHSELGLGEEDVMRRGQLLLDMLGRGVNGHWMVIHGHKHHPKITYAAGTSSSPVVFAAGSLCSTLFLDIQPTTRNQFYLITIDPGALKTFGFVGTIRAWDWIPGMGWEEAAGRSGLPAEIGFGCRTSPLVLAERVAMAVKSTPTPLAWRTVEQANPDLRYLLPQDFNTLEQRLLTVHNIAIRKGDTVALEVAVAT